MDLVNTKVEVQYNNKDVRMGSAPKDVCAKECRGETVKIAIEKKACRMKIFCVCY